ncbi:MULTISPECIES: regulatory YrvL family protein [unclassified Bacillus (in: firmicutes)]|uniref:regulatory YrvL family protein n=1 Tax=unclassified Bacillus (in: firmicutes) TaxID=185979 RepID=UPI00228197F6|nr:regulatory YrvL family protein [Bacillus sp. S20C3]MCY8204857.1 regulatory YrvL family protein [Bacillus sp. N12A5]MCY8288740.1 regulatory YrvL family protein [Bacillus sp. N13C7]MCY8637754.1 regulatory YrvL family protein [Bacillus sp. S17B2]MCY8720370.1 regulatory YrvL family protein [Bacillus sp. S10C12M]MCY9142251.1 regulatory YrvL family protein [Bacillus sp. T9C1]
MKHQTSSKRLLRLSVQYVLAAAAVVLTYFGIMFTLFSLAGTSYRSAAHVLLFAVMFLVLGLCFEPFERLMIHSFTFFKTGKRLFILLAGIVQLLFLWMTAHTTDQLISDIWLSTTEEMIVAAVFLVLDKCNSALPS